MHLLRLLVVLCVVVCHGQDLPKVPAALAGDHSLGGAGVRGRLTHKGTRYITEVLSKSLLSVAVASDAPHAPVDVPVQSSSVKLSNFKLKLGDLSLTKHASVELLPPNQIFVILQNLDLTLTSEINGKVSSEESAGQLILHSKNYKVEMAVKITRNDKNTPSFSVEKCKSGQGWESEAEYNGKLSGAQLNVLKASATKSASEIFEAALCPRIVNAVEGHLNERMSLLDPKISLAATTDDQLIEDIKSKLSKRRHQRDILTDERSLRVRRAEGQAFNISTFNLGRANNLFLDYSIVSDPRVTQFGVEIDSNGEISLKTSEKTPFGPIDVPLPQNDNGADSMLQIIVSDFIPNTLMFHGHDIGLFNTRVDPSTPQFGSIMRTSCDLSTGSLFCIGDLLPTMRKQHPNQRVAMHFKTIQAPVLLFRPASMGGIAFSLLGHIDVLTLDNGDGKDKLIGAFGIEIAANMKMRLTNTMVKGKVNLEKIKLTSRSPKVLLQEELDDAGLLGREVLQRMVNDILKDGIPIPVHPLFRLNKPKVKVINRALLIQADFDLNERLMDELTGNHLFA
uniref:BPI2 domain-containing protein n=1 Tax=Steinernema glaseri TaxID=37863 RepID=A0A1I7ZP32_9BILA